MRALAKQFSGGGRRVTPSAFKMLHHSPHPKLLRNFDLPSGGNYALDKVGQAPTLKQTGRHTTQCAESSPESLPSDGGEACALAVCSSQASAVTSDSSVSRETTHQRGRE
jgi:hypothetical protein